MAAATSDEIRLLAIELGGSTERDEAVSRVLAAADGDRATLVAARDRVARTLHGNSADHAATAALTVLNRAVTAIGWSDPFDWKVRWHQGPLRRP